MITGVSELVSQAIRTLQAIENYANVAAEVSKRGIELAEESAARVQDAMRERP